MPLGTSDGTALGDAGERGLARTATYTNSRSEWELRQSTPWTPMDGAGRQRGAGEVATDGCVLTEPIVLSR